MQSIIQNYSVLQSLWDQATDIVHDTETIARIRGVAAHMQSFEFFFGLVLGEILLHHTDNLSKTLQKNYSASEGQRDKEWQIWQKGLCIVLETNRALGEGQHNGI